MQVKKTSSGDNQATFIVIANDDELQALKEHVLTHFQNRVKIPGFRAGKIPPEVLEKHVDQNSLQSEFLQEAIEQMYVQAANELKLRPLEQPKISVQKFVPFTVLEFEAEVPVLGEVKLADYKNVKKSKQQVKISEKDVDGVISSLQTRLAEKADVSRPAKVGDEVWIDFAGVDSKGEPVKGADGKNYPVIIGSNTFIPGFEDNLIGLNSGEDKKFALTFPKDYGLKALANKKVTFAATVIKIQEVIKPDIDDSFAAKAGPFKTIKELRENIKIELTNEHKQKAQQDFEGELIREISAKSKVAVPDVMIRDQIERIMRELQQNLAYRGQTLPEFLEIEGKSEEQYREEVVKTQAEERVRGSLVLSEIAEKENIKVSPEELDARIQVLKAQYQDAQMQAELNKPEARNDIAARLMTEKTVQKLVSYATDK